MAVATNWITDAANEILAENKPRLAEIEAIIIRHCPFKIDTAYEEVGEIGRKLDLILEAINTIKRRTF